MMLATWITLLSVAFGAFAGPLTHRALSTGFVNLSFALEPKNSSLLHKTVLGISLPESENYGKHLSRKEAKALLEPSQETTQLIKTFLQDTGAQFIETDGQWIHATIKAAAWQQLSKRNGLPEHAGLDLPEHVAKHIRLVHRQSSCNKDDPAQPTLLNAPIKSSKSLLETRRSDKTNITQCASIMTPACLHWLYHMEPNHEATSHHRSLLGIAGFDQQAAQHKELAQFLKAYAPYAVGTDFSSALVNGGTDIQDESQLSAEANADVQYAVAIGQHVSVKYYSVGGENHHFIPDLDLNDTKSGYIEPTLQFASYLLNLPDSSLPQTVSISYGVNEQLVPIRYAQQVCNMFGQLGARGVSIVTGSGDGGPGASCQSNGASGKTKAGEKRFLPFWPASCPYVTAVGSTELIKNQKTSDSGSHSQCTHPNDDEWHERGASFSGGGFSEFFSRPSWQNDVVETYTHNLGDTFNDMYNHHGRAIPDVAVNGCEEAFYNHGVEDSFSGTSVSAPIFAGMIAQLNDQRLRSGKPPLGFLNPWIYSIGNKAFTDIKSGASVGCQGSSYSGSPAPTIPGAGWNATTGWDAVTGLGTPDFRKLKDLV